MEKSKRKKEYIWADGVDTVQWLVSAIILSDLKDVVGTICSGCAEKL